MRQWTQHGTPGRRQLMGRKAAKRYVCNGCGRHFEPGEWAVQTGYDAYRHAPGQAGCSSPGRAYGPYAPVTSRAVDPRAPRKAKAKRTPAPAALTDPYGSRCPICTLEIVSPQPWQRLRGSFIHSACRTLE